MRDLEVTCRMGREELQSLLASSRRAEPITARIPVGTLTELLEPDPLPPPPQGVVIHWRDDASTAARSSSPSLPMFGTGSGTRRVRRPPALPVHSWRVIVATFAVTLTLGLLVAISLTA
jgi:hypothetical protein